MATVESPHSVIEPSKSSSKLQANSVQARHHLLLTLTDGTNQKITDLTKRTGYDKGELVDVAMTLLQLSLDAVDAGKQVGVVASDQDLELEFVGFHKDDPASS